MTGTVIKCFDITPFTVINHLSLNGVLMIMLFELGLVPHKRLKSLSRKSQRKKYHYCNAQQMNCFHSPPHNYSLFYWARERTLYLTRKDTLSLSLSVRIRNYYEERRVRPLPLKCNDNKITPLKNQFIQDWRRMKITATGLW